jgi:2-polyprenyl-3-methyl-5-hydroxy-6-metoxy-1,4-benzoquinol methylase
MQAATKGTEALREQRRFWNDWNAKHRVGNWKVPQVNGRQARMVTEWLAALGRSNLDILEVGCGSGWLCEQLLGFGQITGTDLADEVLPRKGSLPGGVTYVAGNFFELQLRESAFDVVISLETLAHVDDQEAFVEKTFGLLRPGGYLMLATQNRFTLERWSKVVPRAPGQIRKWVDAKTLRSLLEARYEVVKLTSIFPVGDRGIMRFINSYLVRRALRFFSSPEQVDALKERLFLGHTLMALARRPVCRSAQC